MPKVVKRKDVSDNTNKVVLQFDIPMLNALLKYTHSDFVSKGQMSDLLKLIDNLNMDSYRYDSNIHDRLRLIKLICDAKITEKLKSEDLIQMYISKSDSDLIGLYTSTTNTNSALTITDCKFITKAVNERLQYLMIIRAKDDIISNLEKLGTAGFTSYQSIADQLKAKLSKLMIDLQTAGASTGLIRQLNFSDENFASLLDTIVEKAKRPNAVLQTGIRQLNALLSPGFQSGRLYVFLGGTGRFKSGTLLNITDQMRLFNPQVVPVENGRRKTILFVTMENTIEETVERLFDMYSGPEDEFRNMTTEHVMDILRVAGKYEFTEKSGISIEMRYYANLEINTGDLYTLINELSDNGKQVIALVLDYLKRIDSVRENGGDERVRISNAISELKALAANFEIPVITAMQINREGNSIIDAAMRDNRQDIARFVGSGEIAACYDVMFEADFAAIINLERQKSTNKLFLTFKRVKLRGKKDALSVDYFNHPFTNEKEIRLAVDVDKDKPLSVISLASDLESVDEKELEDGRKRRPHINHITPGANTVLQQIDISKIAS
jgi:replicative DNA helicase